MEIKQISTFQAIALIIIIIVNHLVLGTPKTIINETGSGAIINMVYVFILALILVYFLIKLFKNFKGKDILDVSEFLGGKVFKTIIGGIFILYFLIILASTLRLIVRNLGIIYFNDIPIALLTLCILICVAIVFRFGSNSIIKCNSIIAPIAGIVILFISFSNIGDFSFDRIFPILGLGIKKLFLNGASNIFAYSGLVLLFFIMPLLKDSKDFKKISIISTVLTGFLIIASIVSLVLSFPFIDSIKEISSLYIESRDISYWQIFQRIDGIFVFSWILSLLSYISIVIFFITLIFKKITHLKYEFPVALFFIVISYIFSLIPNNINTLEFLENDFLKYLNIIIAIFLSFFILILANIKLKMQSKGSGLFGRKKKKLNQMQNSDMEVHENNVE